MFIHFPIRSDIKFALKRMSELIHEKGFEKPALEDWMTTIKGWKKNTLSNTKKVHITSQEAVEVLYEESKGEAIITTGTDTSDVGSSVLQI